MERESPKVGGHQSEEEGCDPLEGTPSLDNRPIPSCTEDNPQVLGRGRLFVMDDSIIRNIEIGASDKHFDHTVIYLP